MSFKIECECYSKEGSSFTLSVTMPESMKIGTIKKTKVDEVLNPSKKRIPRGPYKKRALKGDATKEIFPEKEEE